MVSTFSFLCCLHCFLITVFRFSLVSAGRWGARTKQATQNTGHISASARIPFHTGTEIPDNAHLPIQKMDSLRKLWESKTLLLVLQDLVIDEKTCLEDILARSSSLCEQCGVYNVPNYCPNYKVIFLISSLYFNFLLWVGCFLTSCLSSEFCYICKSANSYFPFCFENGPLDILL